MGFDVHKFGRFELICCIVFVVEFLQVFLVEGEKSIIEMSIVTVINIAVLILQK